MTAIEEGQQAPEFHLPRDGGESFGLAEAQGRNVVLYFYPKDDTSGCTLEAVDFTALVGDFAAANTTVVGVSKDSVKSHEKFRAKHGLEVVLLSDETGEVCERYGVWVEKSMYGRKYMGIERATFLIDTSGRIRRIWRKVKVQGHAAAVLEAARAL